MSTYIYIYKTTKGYRIRLFLLFLTVIFANISGAFFPFAIGKIVDSVFYNNSFNDFICSFLIYAGFYFFNQLMHGSLNYLWANLSITYIIHLRESAFAHLLHLKAYLLTNINSGDVMKRMSNDVEGFLAYIHHNVFYVIGNIIYIFVAISYLLKINFFLGIVTLIMTPVISYFTRYFAIKIKRKYTKIESEKGSLLTWITELTDNLLQVRILNAGDRVQHNFNQKVSQVVNLQKDVSYTEIAMDRVSTGLALAGQLCVYSIAAYCILRKTISIGEFVACAGYFASCINYFNSINQKIMMTSNNIVAIERYKEFMELEEERDFEGAQNIKINNGEVLFNDVTFSYYDSVGDEIDSNAKKIVLDNISVRIDSGEKVALVGKSGEGKSTLIHLLYRLYEPDKGKILVGGIDIKRYTLHSLRQQIGVVQQANSLFHGTLRKNITFSDEISDDKIIWEILDGLKLKEEIINTKYSLDTIVGVGEREFSGGQKQRIAIARSLYKKPLVLVLDEATSALDKDTESMVFEFINRWLPNSTLIFSSHRFSTIKNADKVIVLENGKIVGMDKPDILYKNCELYKSLYNESK